MRTKLLLVIGLLAFITSGNALNESSNTKIDEDVKTHSFLKNFEVD